MECWLSIVYIWTTAEKILKYICKVVASLAGFDGHPGLNACFCGALGNSSLGHAVSAPTILVATPWRAMGVVQEL